MRCAWAREAKGLHAPASFYTDWRGGTENEEVTEEWGGREKERRMCLFRAGASGTLREGFGGASARVRVFNLFLCYRMGM